MHKARTKARASSMPVHNRCNEIKNRSFISSHACSRGDDTGDTLELHKARTKARASSMPVHNRCNEIKNKTLHLLAVTHAAEATTQETHCTRHVPRRVPRPCPCTTGVMKSRTDIFQQSRMHRGDNTGDTLELHKARTKARASSMPVHNRCNEIKNKTLHLLAVTHAAEATHRRHTAAAAQGTYQGACLVHARAQQV